MGWGEGQGICICVVEKGGISQMITGQKHLAFGWMPRGERPIAEEVCRGPRLPPQVGLQHKLAVRESRLFTLRNTKSVTQFRAIIDPSRGGKGNAAHPVVPWQAFVARFRR